MFGTCKSWSRGTLDLELMQTIRQAGNPVLPYKYNSQAYYPRYWMFFFPLQMMLMMLLN